MALLPLALLSGLATGLAVGGRLGCLASLRPRGWQLAAAAVATQLLAGALDPTGALRVGLATGSDLVVGLFLARTADGLPAAARPAARAVLAGWAANLVALAPGGAMPVDPAALVAAGIGHVDIAAGHLAKHVSWVGSDALSRLLGDWIPLPALACVVSPGDLVMAAGLAGVVAAGLSDPGPAELPVVRATEKWQH